MARRRSKTDRFIKVLAACFNKLGEVDEYFIDPHSVAGGFARKNYSRNRLVREAERVGFLDRKVSADGQTSLVFTSLSGENKEVDLIHLANRPWDGYWRVAAFDIPESARKDRTFIRRNLAQIGFRLFQRSIWVSLLPVEDEVRSFLSGLNLGGQAIIFKTRDLWSGNLERIIDRVWGLSAQRERWQKWMLRVRKTKKKNTFALKQEFFFILEQEPLLPRDLLPPDWPLKKAARLMKKL